MIIFVIADTERTFKKTDSPMNIKIWDMSRRKLFKYLMSKEGENDLKILGLYGHYLIKDQRNEDHSCCEEGMNEKCMQKLRKEYSGKTYKDFFDFENFPSDSLYTYAFFKSNQLMRFIKFMNFLGEDSVCCFDMLSKYEYEKYFN